jgi:parallel beta-helix repeat protein
VLTTDLACSGPGGAPVGIIVAASNVRLVLGKHTLTSASTSTSEAVVGILAGAGAGPTITGLRIVGGTITGFSGFGIFIENASGTRIVGVTASGNDAGGILLQDCAGCQVVNSRANDTGNIGIHLTDSTNTWVFGNTTAGNQFAGIRLIGGGSAGVRVANNVATGNGEFDLLDQNVPTCVNTWRRNRFVTDNESGAAFGPRAGCIR